MPSPRTQGIPVSPLTGLLDTRSEPDQLGRTSLRYRQNYKTTEKGKLCRHGGYEKLLNGPNYNNQDLHDQLLTFTAGAPRQPITFTREVESSRKVRYLFAATQNTLYRLNEWSGNWAMLGTGYGTDSLSANDYRFRGDVLGDYLILSNNYNKVLYVPLEEAPFFPSWAANTAYTEGTLITDSLGNTQKCTTAGLSGALPPAWNATVGGTTTDNTVVWTTQPTIPLSGQPQTIPDLDTIGLTRAAVVFQWRNCVFLGDVDMDGDRYAYRILWSDYNNPVGRGSFDPAVTSSITGFQDLDLRERILAAAEAGDNLLIYTTHAIWEVAVNTGGSQPFAFRKVYSSDKDQSMCLFYANTLVDLGDAHAYMGKDKIYIFSQYYQRPDPVDWMHLASGTLYANLDQSACNAAIGVYKDKEVFFSVPQVGDANNCPSLTLRLQMQYKSADYLDFGLVAACVYRPGQFQTIRDFFIENGICTLAGLTSAGYGYINEGLPNPLPNPEPPFDPTAIYTSDPLTIAGVTTEDYTQPEADSTSLCALLGPLKFDDICRKCDPPNILVGVSSIDWSLKQLTDVLYRERCTNPTAVGTTGDLGYTSATSTYVLDGLDSIMRLAPTFAAEALVRMTFLKLDYLAAAQTPPSQIQLRIGVSAQVADPNTGDCCIVWFNRNPKTLACLSPSRPAEHLANGTIPFQELRWIFVQEGRYLYAELKVSGTGGASCYSGLVTSVITIPVKNC